MFTDSFFFFLPSWNTGLGRSKETSTFRPLKERIITKCQNTHRSIIMGLLNWRDKRGREVERERER